VAGEEFEVEEQQSGRDGEEETWDAFDFKPMFDC